MIAFDMEWDLTHLTCSLKEAIIYCCTSFWKAQEEPTKNHIDNACLWRACLWRKLENDGG